MKNDYKRLQSFPLLHFLKFSCFSLFLLGATLSAQAQKEGLKTIIADGKNSDNFGKSVAIYENFAVVGAWTEDEKGPEAGAAYIMYRPDANKDGWMVVKKITASDGAAFNNFGYKVSIWKDQVTIGAPGHDDFSGAVYIFKRNHGGINNWGELKKVMAHDRTDGKYFGCSIAINDDHLLVGAYGDNQLGKKAGAAYVFKKNKGGENNWGELKKLLPIEGTDKDYFGRSVALNNDLAVVGAEGDNGVGAIVIFGRNEGGMDNWGQKMQILPSDRQVGARFGCAIGFDGDYLAVGAPHADGSSGTVYLFKRDLGGENNWGELKKIKALDGEEEDRFGRHLSLVGDCLIVSSEGHLMRTGAAYLFKKEKGGLDNWGETGKLMANDGEPGDAFGASVSVFGEDILIGAYQDDDVENGSGGVYLFKSSDKSVFASKNDKE